MTDTPETTQPMLSGRTYDFLKRANRIVLPAIGALYYGLALLWAFPRADEVVGTAALLAVFFGAILELSNSSYEASAAAYDGSLVLTANEEGPLAWTLDVDDHLDNLVLKDKITFRVVTPEPEAIQPFGRMGEV